MYSRLTNNGKNLRVMAARLSLAIIPSKSGWEEDDELKSVNHRPSTTHEINTSTKGY